MTKSELALPAVAELYATAERVLGYDLKKVCLSPVHYHVTRVETAQLECIHQTLHIGNICSCILFL